jgi:hypothetical protein
MQPIMVDLFLPEYKAAAAEGAVLELKLRLLADKVPALQSFAHAQSLAEIETQIAHHFGAALTEEERKTLCLCRVLRNKILHGKFRAAREKLTELGIETQHGGVKKVDLAGLSTSQMTEKITHAIAGTPGSYEHVADTEAKALGSVYGWLLEVHRAGDFRQAVDAFKKAAVIVDRLAVTSSTS